MEEVSVQGTEKVKALCLDLFSRVGDFDLDDSKPEKDNSRQLEGEKFLRLPHLRYLTLDPLDTLYGDFEHCLPNLRWLQWRCQFHLLKSITPTNLHLRNLVILDLASSDITEDSELWNQIQMFKKLKVLNLSQCHGLTRVPFLSTFSNLERLVVQCCDKLCSLDGIEELESLRYLDAGCCYSLKTLPNPSRSQIQISKMLKVLDLSVCKYLRRVPFLSTFLNLERLVVSCCYELCSLDGVEELESLRYLDASCCYSLKTLPSLSRLTKLKELKVEVCQPITDIPGLDKLESLELLCMTYCKSLERLPDLSNLKRLKELYVSGTKLTEIRGLGGLKSLEVLDMSNCICIERVFGLMNLKRLKRLDIGCCPKLIEIHGLEGLDSLGCLVMYDCKSIETLPDLSKLKSLKALSVRELVKQIHRNITGSL